MGAVAAGLRRTGKDGFIYRAWMKNQGIPGLEFIIIPVIGHL